MQIGQRTRRCWLADLPDAADIGDVGIVREFRGAVLVRVKHSAVFEPDDSMRVAPKIQGDEMNISKRLAGPDGSVSVLNRVVLVPSRDSVSLVSEPTS